MSYCLFTLCWFIISTHFESLQTTFYNRPTQKIWLSGIIQIEIMIANLMSNKSGKYHKHRLIYSYADHYDTYGYMPGTWLTEEI